MKTQLPTSIALALLFTLASCEDRVPTGGFTAVTPTPSSSAVATRSSTPPTPSAVAPQTPSISDTALAEAERCFSSVAVQRGDSWLTHPGYTTDDAYSEFTGVQFTVIASNTAADTLNGFEYRGKVSMKATASRQADWNAGRFAWGSWQEAAGLFAVEFEIVRRDGNWSCKGLEKFRKPDLAKIPAAPR